MRPGDYAVRTDITTRSIGIEEAERNRQAEIASDVQKEQPELYKRGVLAMATMKQALQSLEAFKVELHAACPDGRAHDVLFQLEQDANSLLKSQHQIKAAGVTASQATQKAKAIVGKTEKKSKNA